MAIPRERTRRDDWIDSDIEAEEKEKKKEKGRPIQKPPRKKKGKKGKGAAAMLAAIGGAGLEEGEQEVMETAYADPRDAPPWRPAPPGGPKPPMPYIPKKKGGVIRGYSSGKRVKASGKPRGVGLAKGIRKAKMVKMKG